MVDVFKNDLQMLHKAGFIHCDLKRPSNIGGEIENQEIQTFEDYFLSR